MEHWFVYYKVPAAQAARLAPRVRAMVDTVGAAQAVRGRLLRRADEPGEQVTLMETYHAIAEPAAFGAALEAALARAELPREWIAARRLERFTDVETP